MPSRESYFVPSARSASMKETPLINRIEEMGLLKDSAETAIRGEGCAVFLYGEAGIGKTRLTRELRPYACSRGMQILYGRCPSLFSIDSIPPYVLWKEVIRDYLQICTPEQLQSIAIAYPSEICKIVPEMKQKLKELPESPPLSPEQERDRLFEAVSQFIENISKTSPLIVFLDDLQWCDSSSLLLLHYLARGIYRDSLLLLGAYRDTEIEEKHPLFPVLSDLKRSKQLQSIRLNRLSLDEVTEMIKQILGQDDVPNEFSKLVFEKTRGNPYFVEEVIQSLKEEGIIYPFGVEYRFKHVSEIEFPESVKSTLQCRLARLDDETQQVLTMASFIGNDFTFEAIRNVTGIEEDRLLEIIERMTEKKLLKCRVVNGEDSCSFSDVLIRDVLYESVGPLRRKRLHGIVASALENAYASDIDEHLGELAVHFLEGGDKEKALNYFLKAGERAEKVYANKEAASYYDSALRLLREKEDDNRERARVLEKLGDIQHYLGESDAALKSWEEALLIQQKLEEKRGVARLLRKTAGIWVQRGETAKAKEHLDKALQILEAMPDSVELAQTYKFTANMFWRSMEPDKSVALVEKAMEIANKLNAYELAVGLYLQLASAFLMNSRKKAVQYYEMGLKAALDHGNVPDAVIAYAFLGNPSMGETDKEKCLEYAEKGYELAKKVGAIWSQSFIGGSLALMQFGMGNTHTGLLLGDESLALSRKSGNLEFAGLSLISLGHIYAVMGEWDKSEKLLKEALSHAQKTENLVLTANASGQLGFLLAQENEYSKAIQYFGKAYNLCEKSGAKSMQGSFLPPVIHATIELGELEKAEAQIDSLQKMAQELNKPSLVGVAFRLRGQLLRAQKKYCESIENFEMALKIPETDKLRRWNVYTFAKNILFEYAKVYIDRNQEGDRQKARNLLKQALELFQKMSAKKDIERTESLLLSIDKGIPVILETEYAVPVATGYVALDKLLYTGIHPNFAVALTSPPCEERDLIIRSYLETGARKGEPTFYVTTNPSLAGLTAEEFSSNFFLFVCNPQAETQVKNAANVFTLKGVENLTNINIALTQAVRRLDPASHNPRRFCIDLISDILLQHGPVQIRKWITELLTHLRSSGFTVLAVIDSQMHPSEQLHAILGLFDGEVNIREAETEKGLARFIRVKRMSGQKYLKDEVRLTEE